jgi:anaerobic magnesium-protoporphyrin IX monomethyl ester cyclase
MSKSRVALVSPIPEFDMIVKNDVLKVHTTIDPFTGSSVTYREPIALQYIDSYLRKNGYETNVFTETNDTSEEMLKKLFDYKPDIIGISVHSAIVEPDTVTLARRVKERSPGTKIVLGGYHPTGEIIEYHRGNLDRTLLHSDDVDFVVCGEGEETFLNLCNNIKDGNEGNVAGIAYKDGGGIKINPGGHRVDFKNLPWPSRYKEVLESSRCAPLAYPSPNKQYAAAQISGSRGCSYNCDFCSSMTIWPTETKSAFGRKKGDKIVQYRDPADFVSEMEWLKKEYGVNYFTLTDLTFNFDKDFANAVSDEIKRRGVGHRPNGKGDIGWFAYATTDKTVNNPEVIERMAEAGCTRVGIGLESLHSGILAEHKPNNSYKNEKKSLEIVNAQGILNRSYLMVGWPDETPEMFDETKNILLSGELPVDQLRIAFVVPFLGTRLYDKYQDRLLTKDWRKYSGDFPVIRNDNMSENEMKDRVKDMLKSFYESNSYRDHIKNKVRRFPHLTETFGYWQEYLQKRGIIDTSHELI